MAKTILFLLHGMGRHEQGWAAGTIAQLNALPAKYGYAAFESDGSFDDRVQCVPIDYDDVFARILKEWGSSTAAIREKAAQFGVDLSTVLGWLDKADELENNFFWTHVVDVLLYRFFAIVTAEVRVRVRDAIAQTLNAAKGDGQLVSSAVLAHSLGTAVAHDALALLGTQPIPTPNGPSNAWMTGNHAFDGVYMCANVSRVLETSPKVYQSVVRPPASGAASYVDTYYNFRHALDPFAAVRPFEPIGWGKRYVATESGDKVLQFNVHDITSYLADPRVHATLYRGLFGPGAVKPAELKSAAAAYDATPEPPCVGEVVRFKTTAQKIISLAKTGADAPALVIGGTQFLAAAQEAKNAC